MVKFPFPTSSLNCAMSVAAFPGKMLGARSKLRPLPLSLIGWYTSCNNYNNNCDYNNCDNNNCDDYNNDNNNCDSAQVREKM